MSREGDQEREADDRPGDRHGEPLAVIHEAAAQFPAAGTREEVAAIVADAATDLAGLPGMVVYLHEGEDLQPAARAGDPDDLHTELVRSGDPDTGPATAALEEGETIRYEEATAGPGAIDVDLDGEVGRALFVPACGHGVVVTCDDVADRYDDRTVRLLETLLAVARTAMDRVEGETELREGERRWRSRRVRLEALADLHALVGDVNAAAVQQTSRKEVERLVCERLAASDAYDLAWFAALDRSDDGVTVKARAGEDPPAEFDGTVAGESAGDGPTRQALRSQELRVGRTASDGSATDEWAEWLVARGFRAVAAIPVVHEGTLYGVLTLCSTRPEAFDGRERDVVGQLGEFLGHVLTAIERKVALTSDGVVELELRLSGMLESVPGGATMQGRVDIDRTVPTGDGGFVQFATATRAATDGFEALLSTLPHVESFARVADWDDEVRYRIEQSDPRLMSIVADEGGLVRGAVIEDGDFDMYVDLPRGADVRSVVEALRAEYPGVELVAQRRTVHRERPREAARAALSERLTDRQRAVLEAAYYAGFFNWPRDTTAEALAETMSISSPTLHYHLRKALEKLLAAILERGPADRDALT